MSKGSKQRATRSAGRQSGKQARPIDPMGTLAMFDTVTDADGVLLAAGKFRCGLCNTMGVDEAGELCGSCAEHVLTGKCRYTRPADAAETATRAPRQPRKTTAKTSTSATPRKTSAATASTSGKTSTSGRARKTSAATTARDAG